MKTLVITEITNTDTQRRQIRDAERVELHTKNKIIVIKDRNASLAQPNIVIGRDPAKPKL